MIAKSLFSVITLLTLLPSCVVMTSKEYEYRKTLQAHKEIQAEINNALRVGDTETCSLSSLLKLLQGHISALRTTELDGRRVNIIKDDLITTYDMYRNKKLSFVYNEYDLEKKIDCYLDFVLNPTYEFVPFWKFWQDSNYSRFKCNNPSQK